MISFSPHHNSVVTVAPDFIAKLAASCQNKTPRVAHLMLAAVTETLNFNPDVEWSTSASKQKSNGNWAGTVLAHLETGIDCALRECDSALEDMQREQSESDTGNNWAGALGRGIVDLERKRLRRWMSFRSNPAAVQNHSQYISFLASFSEMHTHVQHLARNLKQSQIAENIAAHGPVHRAMAILAQLIEEESLAAENSDKRKTIWASMAIHEQRLAVADGLVRRAINYSNLSVRLGPSSSPFAKEIAGLKGLPFEWEFTDSDLLYPPRMVMQTLPEVAPTILPTEELKSFARQHVLQKMSEHFQFRLPLGTSSAALQVQSTWEQAWWVLEYARHIQYSLLLDSAVFNELTEYQLAPEDFQEDPDPPDELLDDADSDIQTYTPTDEANDKGLNSNWCTVCHRWAPHSKNCGVHNNRGNRASVAIARGNTRRPDFERFLESLQQARKLDAYWTLRLEYANKTPLAYQQHTGPDSVVGMAQWVAHVLDQLLTFAMAGAGANDPAGIANLHATKNSLQEKLTQPIGVSAEWYWPIVCTLIELQAFCAPASATIDWLHSVVGPEITEDMRSLLVSTRLKRACSAYVAGILLRCHAAVERGQGWRARQLQHDFLQQWLQGWVTPLTFGHNVNTRGHDPRLFESKCVKSAQNYLRETKEISFADSFIGEHFARLAAWTLAEMAPVQPQPAQEHEDKKSRMRRLHRSTVEEYLAQGLSNEVIARKMLTTAEGVATAIKRWEDIDRRATAKKGAI